MPHTGRDFSLRFITTVAVSPPGDKTLAELAELLEISRSNVYYLPAPTPEKDLALMGVVDELHLEHPFLGVRQLSRILARECHRYAGQPWAMDITYMPMQRGFVYLAAAMDWATRWVLA